MPDVDWSKVPTDVIQALQTGIEQAFFSGGIPGMPENPDPKANPLKNLLDMVRCIYKLRRKLSTLKTANRTLSGGRDAG